MSETEIPPIYVIPKDKIHELKENVSSLEAIWKNWDKEEKEVA